jgi:hypothetical protein
VRQIQHAENAEDERIAEREQAVDRAEPDSVDELLRQVHRGRIPEKREEVPSF